jgi:hypothetical protein
LEGKEAAAELVPFAVKKEEVFAQIALELPIVIL